MHDYLFGIDAVRFAFVFGIIVSMYLYERRHVTTGSIVVPGYIGAFLIHPLVLVATFTNALLSFWIVNRVLPRWVLLYGRNKFAVLVMISVAIQAVMLKVSPSGPYLWESDVPLFVGAGYVIPALIAHDMGRQGIRMTMKVVLVAGTLVGAPIFFAMLFVPNVTAGRPLVDYAAMLYDPRFVPVAVLLGAAAAWAMQSNHGLRAGGFIGTTYLGLMAGSWWQVVYLLAMAVVTWLVVTKALMRVVILFGRRKFSTMLITSSLMSWAGLWFAVAVLGLSDQAFTTLAPVALIPLFLPGLLANDIERVGIRRVASGIALGSVFVTTSVLWLIELTHADRTAVLWLTGCAALITGGIVFDRQIALVLSKLTRVPLQDSGDGGSGTETSPHHEIATAAPGSGRDADALELDGDDRPAESDAMAGSGPRR